MSTFSRVYKPYTEYQHFVLKLLTLCPDFYYLHGDFWHSKNVDVYSFGGRGSQKVYGLYTHENVDIYRQPLTQNDLL